MTHTQLGKYVRPLLEGTIALLLFMGIVGAFVLMIAWVTPEEPHDCAFAPPQSAPVCSPGKTVRF